MFENLDIVVKILKIGLSGFVFLLVFMAFRLLRKEQNVDTPRPIFLKKISQFMWISVLLVIIVGVFSLSEVLLRNTSLKAKKYELWEVEGYVKLVGETYKDEIKGLMFTIQPPHQLPQPDGSFNIRGVPIYKKNGMEMPKLVVRKEGYCTATVDLDPERPKDKSLPIYNITLSENEKEIRISGDTPIKLIKKPTKAICSKCIKECPEMCKKKEKKPISKYEEEKGEKAQKPKAEELPEYKARER